MSNAIVSMAGKLASKFDMAEGGELLDALKATAFRGQVSDAQMMALLAVSNQYGLNPWTKEIYAFPDKNNGIVPVVGVDGWSRIINGHAQFDGIEFDQSADACTCRIYRKDRSHPIVVTEYMDECRRNTGPWQSHPRRMLRHKSMIQAARIAFGYVGIFDQDEAERIVERDMGSAQVVSDAPAASRTQSVKDRVKARQSAAQAAEEPQDVDIETGEVLEHPAPWTYDTLMSALSNCQDIEALDMLRDAARSIYHDLEQGQKAQMTKAINAIEAELSAPDEGQG